MVQYVKALRDVRREDVATVGGKNSSLGEMLGSLSALGVCVPDGFATTADAFREFLQHQGLADRIAGALAGLDVDDTDKLSAAGAQIRRWMRDTPLQPAFRDAILAALGTMSDGREIAVAVRSSATWRRLSCLNR